MALPRRAFKIAKRASSVARGMVCVVAMATPAVAQVPAVGTVIANPAVLGRMFSNLCVEANDAAAVEAALSGVGMIVNPETGTYFHQLFDMSVNPGNGACSMVFVTDQPEADAISAFREVVTRMQGVEVPTLEVGARETGGEIYVRARVEVSW